MGTLLLGTVGLLLVGCSGSSAKGVDSGEDKMGHLALPLVTQGASGVSYHLRDATFVIHHYTGYYYYDVAAAAGAPPASGGSGYGGGDTITTVSSETDPNAQTISVSLEEGDYYVELLPGWHFEKSGPNGAEAVEATLLSSSTQWLWVSRQSTSFAEYQFGIGGREMWLNGQLNIGVVVYEDPKELNGYGGTGGTGMGGYGGTGYAGSGGSIYYAGEGPAAAGSPSEP
jgi:hypothetical protein